jgi:hypothetical protein
LRASERVDLKSSHHIFKGRKERRKEGRKEDGRKEGREGRKNR